MYFRGVENKVGGGVFGAGRTVSVVTKGRGGKILINGVPSRGNRYERERRDRSQRTPGI